MSYSGTTDDLEPDKITPIDQAVAGYPNYGVVRGTRSVGHIADRVCSLTRQCLRFRFRETGSHHLNTELPRMEPTISRQVVSFDVHRCIGT